MKDFVKYVKDKIPQLKLFESDIKFEYRHLMDQKITDEFNYENGKITPCDTDIKRRILYLDTEMISDKLPDWKDPTAQIVCISCYDSYTKEYRNFSIKEQTELSMLMEFRNYVNENSFDVWTAWNIEFDVPYIMARMNKLKSYSTDLLSPIRSTYLFEGFSPLKGSYPIYRIKGVSTIDSLAAYKKYSMPSGSLPSYSLKNIYKLETGKTYQDLGLKIKDSWKKDPDQVIEYCENDVRAIVEIDEKTNLLNLFFSYVGLTGVPLEKTNSSEAIIENWILRYCDKIVPDKKTGENYKYKTEKGLKGGYVRDVTYGLHGMTAVCDVASMYPSFITAYNISPETYEGENIIPNTEFSFKSGENGIIKDLVLNFQTLRKKSKADKLRCIQDYGFNSNEYRVSNSRDAAVKGVVNSLYGVLGSPSFKLFHLECAASITYLGRTLVKRLVDKIEKDKGTVVFVDTDSVNMRCISIDDAKDQMKKIDGWIDEITNSWGVEKGSIVMELEKVMSKIFFTAKEEKKNVWRGVKKSYACHVVWAEGQDRDEIVIKGFSTKRSDASSFVTKVMEKFFKVLLKDGKEKAVEYVVGVAKDYENIPIKDLAMPRKINKEIPENKSPYIRGRNYMIKNYDFVFDTESSVHLIYIKPDEKNNIDCIAIQPQHRIPKSIVPDKFLMFSKNTSNKFSGLFHALGYDYHNLIEMDVMKAESEGFKPLSQFF